MNTEKWTGSMSSLLLLVRDMQIIIEKLQITKRPERSNPPDLMVWWQETKMKEIFKVLDPDGDQLNWSIWAEPIEIKRFPKPTIVLVKTHFRVFSRNRQIHWQTVCNHVRARNMKSVVSNHESAQALVQLCRHQTWENKVIWTPTGIDEDSFNKLADPSKLKWDPMSAPNSAQWKCRFGEDQFWPIPTDSVCRNRNRAGYELMLHDQYANDQLSSTLNGGEACTW